MLESIPTKKVTKSQFEQFKDSFRHYAEVFGTRDWDFYFSHDADEDHMASVSCNTAAHVAHVQFATECPREMANEFDIDKTALHEVLHVVLDELTDCACVRKTEEELEHVQRLNEALAVRLTNAISILQD